MKSSKKILKLFCKNIRKMRVNIKEILKNLNNLEFIQNSEIFLKYFQGNRGEIFLVTETFLYQSKNVFFF